MKKRNLFLALASGMVMFSACSNDEGLMDDANVNAASDAQQIVLQVANTGDGMKTRAGRPLYSSEAGQQVNNVTLIVCNQKDNKVAYTTTINNWTTVSKKYETNGHGTEYTFTIPKDNKLTEGSYTVYAVGYSNDSEYTSDAKAAIGTVFTGNTILNFQSNKTPKNNAEEIFAGSLADIKVGKDKNIGFRKPVVLNRQVAGAFTYVKDIPYYEGAAKLRLVAATRNQNLVLGHFANFDLVNNGTNNTDNINYVVNGANPAADKVLYEIDLTKWFKSIKDDNNDQVIDLFETGQNEETKGNWIGNSEGNLTNGRPKYAIGSVFGGQFVIPFQKADANSLELQLTNNDGSKVLRTWVIKLPTAEKSSALIAWNGNNFAEVASYEENEYQYSVVRNHLYGVGKRTFDGTPTDPNPDPDPETEKPGTNEPESLNNKQELILRVNDNWEVIHDMEIE